MRRDELKYQSSFLWVPMDFPNRVDEVWMLSCGDTSSHFIVGRAVGGDFAFEEFDGYVLLLF